VRICVGPQFTRIAPLLSRSHSDNWVARVGGLRIDITVGDWAPKTDGSRLLSRNVAYTRPLNSSVGPKSTKCYIEEENLHVDFDNYIEILITTRTPDVPSGGSFSIKTKACIMWARFNRCRLLVTTQVEWSKGSFLKGTCVPPPITLPVKC
jgi:VAD1 Analog of StAR-related lipid transfer domain